MSELTPEELRKRRLARLGGGPTTDVPVVPGVNPIPPSETPQDVEGIGNIPGAWGSPEQDPSGKRSKPLACSEEGVDLLLPPSQEPAACPTETPCGDVHMQTVDTDNDSCEKSFLSQLDVDSGIENMEVDELERRDSIKHKESKETIDEQVQACLSRVFRACWQPLAMPPGAELPESTHLPQTACLLQLRQPDSYSELIQQVLTESLQLLRLSEQNPFVEPAPGRDGKEATLGASLW